MKRVIMAVFLAIAALFCCQPQADAFGGAIAIIPENFSSGRILIFEDPAVSKRFTESAKKYLPQGYTIHCSKETTEQCVEAYRNGYSGSSYASAYGYDFVIYMKFRDPYMDTIHFNHPRSQFDIYDMSISSIATVIGQEESYGDTEWLCFTEDTAQVRRTPTELHYYLVYEAADALLYHCGRKINRVLYGDPEPTQRPSYW